MKPKINSSSNLRVILLKVTYYYPNIIAITTPPSTRPTSYLVVRSLL